MTVMRNPVWESNEKLFFADVKTSGNSAKIRNACGGVLFDKAVKEKDENVRTVMLRDAVTHLNKALEIYPNYKDALISRGGCQFYLKMFDGAVEDYRTAMKLAPDDPRPKQYLAIALRDAGKHYGEVEHNLPKAMRSLQESWKLNNTDAETARLMGVAHGVQGQNLEAVEWFQKAVDLAPDNASYLFDLGTAKALSGDVAGGEILRKKALEMNPKLLEDRAGGKK
jgi:tetratricopeptide (TPR) repeat protein